MKLAIDLGGERHTLEMRAGGAEFLFDDQPGAASIEQIKPGVFSVLLGAQSFRIHVAPQGEGYEIVGNDGIVQRLAMSDPRDQAEPGAGAAAKGPMTVRAPMPGKIVKLLVSMGETVQTGQSILVMEAMKMQNEVKAPKSGVVAKILAAEGATVAAGETMIVVD